MSEHSYPRSASAALSFQPAGSDQKSLIQIASSPDFARIETHREAGLAGQLNIAVRGGALG